MTEAEILRMAQLMSRGGCENILIAKAVSQAARSVADARFRNPQQARDERQRIVDTVRADGWFQ